jgi:hypothetical protein
MGNFIDNYSESRVREAYNMLEEFKKNVKYFVIKKSEVFGYRTEIYKVKNVSKKYFHWGNGNVVTLQIDCIRIEIYEPNMESLINKGNSITLLCGPKSFKFELTCVPKGGFECVNMEGISDMIDFFSRIETIDKIEAQKYFEDFKNKTIEEINKNLM